MTIKSISQFFRRRSTKTAFLVVMAVAFAGAYFIQPQAVTSTETGSHSFSAFSLFSNPKYTEMEVVSLLSVLGIAVGGLIYALLLSRQVLAADKGTQKMQDVANAVRKGANAYLAAQFKQIGPLIIRC